MNFPYYILLSFFSLIYVLVAAFAGNRIRNKKQYSIASALLFVSWICIIGSGLTFGFTNFGVPNLDGYWLWSVISTILQSIVILLIAISVFLVIQSFLGKEDSEATNSSN